MFSIVILMSTALAGCLNTAVTVTVNTDGSGIVTETMQLSKDAEEMMSLLASKESGGKKKATRVF